jgi:hypothetical protein
MRMKILPQWGRDEPGHDRKTQSATTVTLSPHLKRHGDARAILS